jgi:hypothetical protein
VGGGRAVHKGDIGDGMRPKDLLIRTAIDVRKMGAPHSGSVLKNPGSMAGGGGGMGLWQPFTPGISVGGVYLAATSYTIYDCYYTIWGIMVFWFAYIDINNFEGRTGSLLMDKPTGCPNFHGPGYGIMSSVGGFQGITFHGGTGTTTIRIYWPDGTDMNTLGDFCANGSGLIA